MTITLLASEVRRHAQGIWATLPIQVRRATAARILRARGDRQLWSQIKLLETGSPSANHFVVVENA